MGMYSFTGLRSIKNKGSILLATTVIIGLAMTFVLASMVAVHSKVCEADVRKVQLQSCTVADAGLEQGTHWIRETMKIWGSFSPIDNLDTDPEDGIEDHATLVIAAGTPDGTLTDAAGNTIGEYDIFFDVSNRGSSTSREITILARSFIPSKTAVQNGLPGIATSDAASRLLIRQVDGKAGNYSYFINHWGWFYGSSITSNGSDRANGKFTLRYNPTINGSPIYEEADGSDLQGQLNDGGVFAGLNIDGSCRGMGGCEDNQYEYEEPIIMPNLSNLTYYKAAATANGSTLTVGGTEFTGNGVYGDDAGEKENLYLEGTAADPIEINGTVVVDGTLVIKGYVTGQGAIITKDNIHVAGNIQYVNGPTTTRPASDDEATTEQWIQDNMDKDFLGLYAGEHVVVGDMSNNTWQNYVFGWLNHSANRSDEDAGADMIHATGDSGEDDGQWDVEYYTQVHQDLGLIPSGTDVGDPIPGTGEDIDGDGTYDERITTNGHWRNEFKTSTSINSNHWGGTLPAHGYNRQYKNIAEPNIYHLDGCFYTNHAFAGFFNGGGNTITFNGALISRNESIVYTPRLTMNHDERLTGRSWTDLGIIGGGGKVWDDIVVQAYWTNQTD